MTYAMLRKTALAAATALTIPAFAFAGAPEEPRIVDFAAMGKKVGKSGGTLRLLMGKSKDIAQMTVYSGTRLVTYDQTFKLKPDLLKAVDVDANKTFTLHLRKGHLWSDGTPFTAEDFRFWWEDVANNKAVRKGGVPRALLVDGKPPKFEVIDSRTVRYSWDAPNPLFLTAIAAARPLYIYQPAHFMKQFHEKYADPDKLAEMVKEEKVEKWGSLYIRKGRQYRPENPDMPTLQPWRNSTQLPSQRIVFKRNPNFHRVDPEGNQLPYLDEVVLNISSSSVIPAKAGTGDADLQGRYLRFDNYAFLKQGEGQGGYITQLWPSGRGSELVLLPNLNAADEGWRKAMQDVNVRRALSMAIDREEINEVVFFDLARPAANSVLPSSPLYQDKFGDAYAQRDLDEANRLLDAAGYDKRDDDGFRLLPDGRKMEIIVETAGESSQETDILQLITDHLSDIGVAMFVKPGQRDILRSRVANGEVVMSTWSGLNRGLATSDMDPEELAPVSPVQGQWPAWGLYTESKGSGGEKPTLPEVLRLSELYKSWRVASSSEEQAQIWTEMLSIFTDQVYSIGTVAGGLQPVVVSTKLRNVPKEGIWAFEPTQYFGHYLPDTFWFEE